MHPLLTEYYLHILYHKSDYSFWEMALLFFNRVQVITVFLLAVWNAISWLASRCQAQCINHCGLHGIRNYEQSVSVWLSWLSDRQNTPGLVEEEKKQKRNFKQVNTLLVVCKPQVLLIASVSLTASPEEEEEEEECDWWKQTGSPWKQRLKTNKTECVWLKDSVCFVA